MFTQPSFPSNKTLTDKIFAGKLFGLTSNYQTPSEREANGFIIAIGNKCKNKDISYATHHVYLSSPLLLSAKGQTEAGNRG